MAKHLLKYSDWQSGSGKWYCNDITDLCGQSAKWYMPARMLGLPLTDFILLLKNDYKANIVKYNPDVDLLIYNWDNYNDCHKFVLFINREAKKRNFIC